MGKNLENRLTEEEQDMLDDYLYERWENSYERKYFAS